jgi:hypothetical protein
VAEPLGSRQLRQGARERLSRCTVAAARCRNDSRRASVTVRSTNRKSRSDDSSAACMSSRTSTMGLLRASSLTSVVTASKSRKRILSASAESDRGRSRPNWPSSARSAAPAPSWLVSMPGYARLGRGTTAASSVGAGQASAGSNVEFSDSYAQFCQNSRVLCSLRRPAPNVCSRSNNLWAPSRCLKAGQLIGRSLRQGRLALGSAERTPH